MENEITSTMKIFGMTEAEAIAFLAEEREETPINDLLTFFGCEPVVTPEEDAAETYDKMVADC